MEPVSISNSHSSAGLFWEVITTLWSSHWLSISIFLIVFILYEIVTRNGNVHYNSKNGFSPTFNRVIGSGTYLLFQGILYACLHFIFGDSIYQHPWPYFLHLLVFGFTGFSLRRIGFWVY